jgi:hypothetical protein
MQYRSPGVLMAILYYQTATPLLLGISVNKLKIINTFLIHVDCVIFQAQQRFCGFESFPGSEGTGANYI